MENFQNSTFIEKTTSPEQRLWQAVLGQVLYDLLSDYTNNYIEDSDKQLAEYWSSHKHKDFVDVCRNAGFNPDYVFDKIHKLKKLKKSKKINLVFNYRKKEREEKNEWENNMSKM